MMLDQFPSLHLLSPAQKRLLAEALWESADADENEQVAPTTLDVLKHKLTAYGAAAGSGPTWEAFRAEAESRLHGSGGSQV